MFRSVLVTAFALAVTATASAQNNPPRHNTPTGPITLYPQYIRCAEVPGKAPEAPAYWIVGGQNTDGHISYVKGDEIVLNGGTNINLAVGQRYVVRRTEGHFGETPATGEQKQYDLSYHAIRTVGWVTVTAVNEKMALANVDFSCDTISAGNYLEPLVEPVVPASAGPRNYPDFDDRAIVLYGDDRRQQIADGEMAYIDRGSMHGVVAGARFAVYRDRHIIGLPLVYVGDGVITEVMEKTSQMVIVSIKDAIYAGDTVVPRKLLEPKQ
jgi:hypothetical protein